MVLIREIKKVKDQTILSKSRWLDDPGTFLTPGTPPMHVGRPGEGPAVAPRRYRWTVGRSAFRL